ncbi:MAG TPA: rod shape-determining protein MreD [Candidatus Saccharimonadales bacterium]|nr:rod shape-determining protein MreD [Candidatus Saccharimonadales bacterium]
MKAVGKVLIILGLVWVQVGLFGHWRPLGVMPNLMLLAVLFFGLYGSATTTLGAAVFGGFLLDNASTVDFGLRMAFYSVAALGIIASRQLGLRVDSLITMLLAVTLGTILFDLVIISTVNGTIAGNAYSMILSEVIVNDSLALILMLGRTSMSGQQSKPTKAAWA